MLVVLEGESVYVVVYAYFGVPNATHSHRDRGESRDTSSSMRPTQPLHQAPSHPH